MPWQQIQIEDRRGEPRSSLGHPVEIKVRGRLITRNLSAQLVNVSPSGLRLILDRAIPAGTHISVAVREETVFGEVKYCNRGASGYEAGIQIEYAVRAVTSAPGTQSVETTRL